MLAISKHELPPDKEQRLKKAKVLEWVTIGFMLSVIVVMYFVMGSSQAMKTAWAEDILSLVPPIAFLVSSRVARREPNKDYPYGYHRAVSIAFLWGAVALFAFGLLLLFDGARSLIKQEHPTIQSIDLFGHTVWMGWLMIAALLYSAVPPMILGRMKLPLAEELHDKTLFADANMNKADWLTALAAILGILGIGVGWWWADAAAACLISADVTHDGYKNLRTAITDLMNRHPVKVDEKHREALPEQLVELLESYDWVSDAEVRLREEGHVFMGEAFIVPASGVDVTGRLPELVAGAKALDWRMNELVIMPVERIEPPNRRES